MQVVRKRTEIKTEKYKKESKSVRSKGYNTEKSKCGRR